MNAENEKQRLVGKRFIIKCDTGTVCLGEKVTEFDISYLFSDKED